MVTLPVYDRSGAEVGRIDIDPTAIAPKISKQLLHDAVVMYQSNLRLGTKRTKGRGEVSGSTKKMYRQKGTGNARMGSKRTPQRRGGGHAMQLRPRSFYYRLPKKAIRAATRMAMATRLVGGSVIVVDQLDMAAPKTKELFTVLKALGLAGQTTLVATAEHAPNVYMSGRNIPGLTISKVADLNALMLMRPKRVLLTKGAIEAIKTTMETKTTAA